MPDVTPPTPAPESSTRSTPGFGTATAAFVVVSSMVGVGVLTTSGLAVDRLGSNQLMLILWLVGGVIALCGALSLAEVSAALPRSGGEYAIFRVVYGRLPSFLAGWVSCLFGFSAPIAMSASGASGYLLVPFGDGFASNWIARSILATGLIMAITVAHISGRTRSIRLQGTMTLLTVGFLVVFTVAGLWAGRGGLAHLDDRPPIDVETLAGMLFSLIYVSYGYTGWNAASYIAGEISDPGRKIPRAILCGTLAVAALYVALNLVYALALSSEEVRAMAREQGKASVIPIAQVAANRLFGPAWAGSLAIGVGLMLVATTSALLLTGPRVLVAMAKAGLFPGIAARTRADDGTPASASILLAGWGIILLWTGSFDAILLYSGVGLAITSMLSVASVIVLRWREPGLPRPFRVPGYPWVPAFFLVMTLALTLVVIATEKTVAACSILSIAAGCPIYYAMKSFGQSDVNQFDGKVDL